MIFNLNILLIPSKNTVLITVVAKMIRTLVFSPAKKNGFKSASWRCCHSSSGFSLSQFVLFLHVIPDRLNDDQIRSVCGALVVVRQKSH